MSEMIPDLHLIVWELDPGWDDRSNEAIWPRGGFTEMVILRDALHLFLRAHQVQCAVHSVGGLGRGVILVACRERQAVLQLVREFHAGIRYLEKFARVIWYDDAEMILRAGRGESVNSPTIARLIEAGCNTREWAAVLIAKWKEAGW